MNADSIIMDEETAFLDKVFNDFGLSVEEFDHMEELDIDLLHKDFILFSNEKKEYAKDLFLGMSSCDGIIDPRETAIIDKFCSV